MFTVTCCYMLDFGADDERFLEACDTDRLLSQLLVDLVLRGSTKSDILTPTSARQ